MISFSYRAVCLSAVLVFSLNNAFASEFYKWVDARGTTHYTKTPPPKTAQKKSKVSTYGWRNNTSQPPAAPSEPAAGNASAEASTAASQVARAAQEAAEYSQQQAANDALEKGQRRQVE